MSDLINSATKLEEQNQPGNQGPTEKDMKIYRGYDQDLISAVLLHNGSLAGIRNPHPQVKFLGTLNEAIVTRCADEELAIFTDSTDQALIFSVGNPQVKDSHHEEMLSIYLSRQEVEVLRSLLNKAGW